MLMRFKNFTLLFLMGIFGLFTTNLFAQEDATIDPANIRYWISEGENEVVFIVNWNEPDTALAWGYRFNGESVIVKDMMLEIAATDPRFDFVGESFVNDVTFNDGVLNLALAGMWWMYNVNGQTAGEYFNTQTVVNGDVVKFGDESCGIMTDPLNYYYIWTKEVVAVYPYAEDATIDPAEITYWVGEGDNEAIFAVNWAEPNVCYAWGYRFVGESVTVKDVMDVIAAVDHRFAYEVGGWGVTNITFDYNDIHLALVGDYWMYNINGVGAGLGYDAQPVTNGDFIKWGDIACATEVAEWSYVWETPVVPVVNNTSVGENVTSLALYPNPATSYTMLEVSGMSDATVTVTDLQGRVLNSFAVAQTNEPIRIETAGYQAGIYFVTISDATSRQTVKLSVK